MIAHMFLDILLKSLPVMSLCMRCNALLMPPISPRLKALLNLLGSAHTRRLYYAITAMHRLCVVTLSLRMPGLNVKASLISIDTIYSLIA